MRNRTFYGIHAALAAVSLAFIAACGGAGSFTAHGGETVCIDAADVTTGTQVTVVDSNSHVIGTGTLTDDNSAAAQKAITAYDTEQLSLGVFGQATGSGMGVYTFTATVPSGETRYGVNIGQNRGTLWFSENQMKSGPQISLGC